MKRMETPAWLRAEDPRDDDWVVEEYPTGVIVWTRGGADFKYEAVCAPGYAFEVPTEDRDIGRHTEFCATLKDAREALRGVETCGHGFCEWCSDDPDPGPGSTHNIALARDTEEQ